MSDHERNECRTVQDRWLVESLVKKHIKTHGEDVSIAMAGSPTFREVRECLLPEWTEWFKEFTQ
jgi:hypothetical protein